MFGSGKLTSSNNMKLVDSKTKESSTGAGSDTWLSHGEQNLRRQGYNGYPDLSSRSGKVDVHVVDISMDSPSSDPRYSFQADDYECSKNAAGRQASLI